ncbi:hypothetical protein D3C71_1192360 [compost metagenome]
MLLAPDRSQSIIGEIVDGQTNPIGYSAYGDQSAQHKIETRLGFNGQLREASIGWYLLGNGYRAYNPRLMRFHSPDSWSPFGGGGLNAYMYCAGDPLNRADPTGHNFVRAIYYAVQDARGKSTYKPSLIGVAEGAEAMRSLQKNRSYEKTHDMEGMLGAFARISVPEPKAPPGKYPPQGEGNNNNPGSVFSRNTGTALAIATAVRPSRSSGRHIQMGGVARRTTKSDLPPTYEQATSRMELWNHDTFAASQRRQSYVVNRMEVAQLDNLGAAAPYQSPAGAPPPPRVVVEHNQLLQAHAELNAMQRDVIQHRVAEANWRCRIL